jgi:hypothetical protein
MWMVLVAAGCGHVDGPKTTLACNISGLSATERKESRSLLSKLEGSVVELRELDDGYAFRIDESKLGWTDLSRWIELERRCCPFFGFAAEVTRDGGPVWLRLTGGEEVKDFIRQRLGS